MKKLIPFILCILLLTGCAESYTGPTETVWVISEFHKELYSLFTDYVQTERVVYAYDIYGNVAQVLEYHDGEERLKTVYTYDDRGNQLTETGYALGGWFPRREWRYERTYDDQNRLLTDICEQSGERSEYRYTYDDAARTCTTTFQGELYAQEQFDENGTLLSRKQFDGDYWFLNEYTRDAEGRVLTNRETDSDGLDRFYRYEYDDHGNCICYGSIIDGTQTESRYEYEYDDLGRCLRRFELTDTSRHEISRWEYLDENGSYTLYRDGSPDQTITCDEQGHEIEHIHYSNGTDEIGLREVTVYRQIQVPAKEETP